MIGGRPSLGAAVLLVVLPVMPSLAGCARTVEGEPTAAAASAVPHSVDELSRLLVTDVPSGLPRVPDDQLQPPAGPKSVDDIADYSDDPEHERHVLAQYGYRYGWERFWGTGPARMTELFVDQFEARAGAGSYARDLARNESQRYDAVVHENPAQLPGGCRMLTVDDADAQASLGGPTAIAWCAHGSFSVSVTAIADSLEAAEGEVRAVVRAQLDRLPP